MLFVVRCPKCVGLRRDVSEVVRFPSVYRRQSTVSRKTHYEVLGITEKATQQQIKSAFILKSKQTHPDVNPKDSAKHREFIRVNEAYTILKDPVKKKEYDYTISRDKHGPQAYSAGRTGPYPKQEYQWGQGPFPNHPRDAQGRYGFYDYRTGKYDFDQPLGETMKGWAERAERHARAQQGYSKQQTDRLLRRSMLLIAFGILLTSYTYVYVRGHLLMAGRGARRDVEYQRYLAHLRESGLTEDRSDPRHPYNDLYNLDMASDRKQSKLKYVDDT